LGTAPCVFIVDDDDAVRDSLRLLLEAHGYTVKDCATGDELLTALPMASAGCLVLDYHLTRTNGLDLLAEVRARAVLLPAILVSGMVDDGMRRRARDAGISDVLEKPFQADALIDAVDSALHGS
jgi:two-component system response regulator FixJ